ncbi:MAG: hypothetical protein KKC20_12410, partial [Proteobacteria bacterium]|nr:hypothetical protein [Pseudomonadota bacterium]
NPDGTLNVKCLIDMGDKDLFLGPHSLPEQATRTGRKPRHGCGPELLQKIKDDLFSGRFSISSVVTTPSPAIVRVHKTRVELALTLDTNIDSGAMDYIRENPDITDVIFHVPDGGETIISQLTRIGKAVNQLGRMKHIACVRLRWASFQTRPEAFTLKIINQLAGLANFSLGNPLKIEIETWWLMPRDLLPAHGRLAGQLNGQGIQTYANLPLIIGVNDDPAVICEMAQGLRGAGMEFHHCYVAGLAVQDRYNGAHPIKTDQVLAIASHVRKVCSGREIPLYMIQTPLGEVDFGLTATLVRDSKADPENANEPEKEKWFLQLSPYDVLYFTAMDPGFDLAKTGARDVDGILAVPLKGLVRSGDFSL